MMSLDKELLIEQYVQCNEHLRDTDRKRDTILGMYMTVTLGIYGLSGILSQQSTPGQLLSEQLLPVAVGLSMFGAPIGFLLTFLRGWHGLYVIQAIVFQEILHGNATRIEIDFIRSIRFSFNHAFSAEMLTFVVAHVIIFTNAIVAYHLAYNTDLKVPTFGLIVFAFVEFISHFFAMELLDARKRSGKLGTEYLWMLQSTIDRSPLQKPHD